jgi:hypothetical protein
VKISEVTMAQAEIDSFILKFKNLLLSGRNATLVMKSNAGKAEVSLNVDLGHVPPLPVQHQEHRSRDGPSRQRRRLRRAQACTDSKAEEASEVIDDESIAAVQAMSAKDNVIGIDHTEPKVLEDEFCSDEIFEKQAELTFEKESDEALIESILVIADCQADWKDSYVTKLVDEKLNSIGINMKSIVVNRNVRKCFESCLVRVEPTRRSVIENQTFPIRRWTMKCIL